MMHCPENEKIICAYLENGDGVLVRDCIGCKNHDNGIRATGALPFDDHSDGLKAVFWGVLIIAGIFSALYFIINAFRR